MKSWILALGALAVVESGCSPVVLDPLEENEATPLGPILFGTPMPANSVLAFRGGDVNWNDNCNLALMKGKFWSDPDSRVLFFSGDTQQCSDPVLAARCGVMTFWQTILAIPPELDVPGVIDLQDPRVRMYNVMSNPEDSPTCGGGGMVGGVLSVEHSSTLEIIDDGLISLTVKVRGVVSIQGNALDGDYHAHICGS